jgi:hypothetical protein
MNAGRAHCLTSVLPQLTTTTIRKLSTSTCRTNLQGNGNIVTEVDHSFDPVKIWMLERQSDDLNRDHINWRCTSIIDGNILPPHFCHPLVNADNPLAPPMKNISCTAGYPDNELSRSSNNSRFAA